MTQTQVIPKRALPAWFSLVLATASACLWVLSVPPFRSSWLAWFAMIPLMLVLDRTPSFARAMLFCCWAGLVENIGGFHWLVETVRRFTGISWTISLVIVLLVCLYQSLVFVLFGAAVHTARHRGNIPMALVAPLAFVAAELLVPMVFPNSHAITQAFHPLVIQIADLTGPIGVSALLLLVNGALYDLLVRRRQALLSATLSGIILIACLLYGEVRMRHFDRLSSAAPRLRVGIVQPNFAYVQTGSSHTQPERERLAILQEQSNELEMEGAQLIVWSETSYPFLLSHKLTGGTADSHQPALKLHLSTPVIIGAQTINYATHRRFNSALLVDRDGKFAGIYDKMRLLSFGERVPAGESLPWLTNLMPREFARFTPGVAADPLLLKTTDGKCWRLGTFICFEDTLPDVLRKVGANRPQLLVNITNDSWFGETPEPWEHLALSVFDSIEQRCALVRSVNSGVSAFIDANGRVIQKTYAVDPYVHPVAASHSLGELPFIEGGHTVYAHTGNLFAYLCSSALLLLLLQSWCQAREPK
jgi:apolipoprotein N-acyltransferase